MCARPRQLIACDFDGTISAVDTMDYLCRTFTPEVFDELEGQLLDGARTLHDLLGHEIVALRDACDDLAAQAVHGVPLRAGFAEFLASIDPDETVFVVVSSGFRQLIEPMLAAAGHAGLEVIANDVDLDADTGGVQFRDHGACGVCGQPCKRGDIAALLARYPDIEEVVFIGDGYSDRCGSQVADRIFAMRDLAEWLDQRGVAHTRVADFHDVVAELGW